MPESWELTEEEGIKAVQEWIAADYATRIISVNRGHFEQLIPVIVCAAAQKLLDAMESESFDMGDSMHVPMEYWRKLRCELELQQL